MNHCPMVATDVAREVIKEWRDVKLSFWKNKGGSKKPLGMRLCDGNNDNTTAAAIATADGGGASTTRGPNERKG